MAGQTSQQSDFKGSQANIIYTRSERFLKRDDGWYYTTRENGDMGPYADKAEAQMALVYFIERTQWPDEKQLRAYI
ncbi:MAG: DUF6316 family protein, partial [Pseudomonadales bacterium]